MLKAIVREENRQSILRRGKAEWEKFSAVRTRASFQKASVRER